ncbi:hypothetical protein C3L33_02748, partial [Rhododendron williamsianum]
MASPPDSISLEDSSEGSNDYPNFVLVGKIISIRKPHRQGVFNVINKAWRTRGNFSISIWRDSLYAFTFDLEEDLLKITNQAPWSVMGGLLVLARWNHDMTIEDLDFSHSPFWVQIHGLPLGQMNRKNGEAIANLIGKLDSSGMKTYDTSTFKDYLRLRVIIDITRPLKKGFFLKRREKEDLWIRFKYERLSDFCYVCGLIGHGLNDCTKKFDGDRSGLEYGSFLRAEISITETINPGKPAPTISNSSSEEFVAVESPLVTAAHEPAASVSIDGTISVRKDKAVIFCDKPAGKDLPGDATCPSSIPFTCSPRSDGISAPPFVIFTDFKSQPIDPTFKITQLGPPRTIISSNPDYYVEEPPDSPGRKSPVPTLGPSSPVNPQPLHSSDLSPHHTPSPLPLTRPNKSLSNPNPPATVGLSSIFDKLLCLKRKSPPSSPSNTPPPTKVLKTDYPAKG